MERIVTAVTEAGPYARPATVVEPASERDAEARVGPGDASDGDPVNAGGGS